MPPIIVPDHQDYGGRHLYPADTDRSSPVPEEMCVPQVDTDRSGLAPEEMCVPQADTDRSSPVPEEMCVPKADTDRSGPVTEEMCLPKADFRTGERASRKSGGESPGGSPIFQGRS